MKVEPVEDLLKRNIDNQDYTVKLSFYSDSLRELVNIGTHVLKWESEILLRGDRVENTAIIMLIRHTIDLLDTISELIKLSCLDTTQIVLRAFLEACWQLEYMLKEDNDIKNRAYCYMVCFINRRLKSNKKYLNGSPEQKTHFNHIKNYSSVNIYTVPFNQTGLLEEIKNDEHLLNSPEFSDYQSKYLELTKKNPDWFTLVNKNIQSIDALTVALSKKDHFELLYRDFSTKVHGSDVLTDNIVFFDDGNIGIREIRYTSIQMAFEITFWATQYISELYLAIVKKRNTVKFEELKLYYRSYSDSYKEFIQDWQSIQS